jgi:molecular chaperone DnaK
LTKLKEAHKQQDLAAVDAGTKELNEAWMAASQDMYNATQGAGQPGGPTPDASASTAQPGAENVTDAEFEEVK